MNKCPVCGQDAKVQVYGALHQDYKCDCKICGVFDMTEEAFESIVDYPVKEKSKISAYIRFKMLNNYSPIHISVEQREHNYIPIQDILDDYPKTFSGKIDKILLNLSKLTNYTGEYYYLKFNDYPLFYVENPDTEAFDYIIQYLKDFEHIELKGYENLMALNDQYKMGFKVRLTPNGWDNIYKLEKLNTESNKVFIAMSFNKDLNSVYDNGIKKAVKDCYYDPIRVDSIEHNEKICDIIIAEIKQSKFLICDFTDHKGGVYFEAGFALGLGLPVIWTCREDEIDKSHFDTRQYNHIAWIDEKDLYIKLKNRILATIS